VLTGTPKFYNAEDVHYTSDDYYSEGTISGTTVADLQVSTAGFSAVGRSPGFFLTTKIETKQDFEIDKVIL